MTTEAVGVAEGQFLATPMDLTTPNGPEKLEYILQQAMDRPEWFATPHDRDQRMQSAYWILVNPGHLTWEVWRGSELVGILLLWRITPKVDALLHFVFFDRNLSGKVRLLRRFLRYCFTDLGFQRISLEIPEDVPTLVSFARRKLSFRFEGEDAFKQHPLVSELESLTGSSGNPHVWWASVGSRRERTHWRDTSVGKRGKVFPARWIDTICLRLTAPEFRERHPGG